MVRHYSDLCPTCNLELPKGPAKKARHFAKHKEIFATRYRRYILFNDPEDTKPGKEWRADGSVDPAVFRPYPGSEAGR